MANELMNILKHPIKFRMFLFSKLPVAFFCGLRLPQIDESSCVVTISFKWLTKNPFKSTYFACLSMAAEMSTGALGLAHVYKRTPSVSMLVVNMNGSFLKKAIGKTIFTCNDGLQIKQTIEDAIATGQGKTITAKSIGKNEQGEVVAEFNFTWSFKSKKV